ncbi:MAG: lysophospholipid acyltransferase family protein [Zoogloeaceae bacterium]|jgi:KDO2-lipid IV(A) lauroyltransferase|nr:lysophospholipid acyltransferase family protein [Zoogloeaceae bacterium]
MVLVFRCLALLPLRLLHFFGAAAGLMVYALSPRYRRHLRENMAAAGIPASLNLAAAREAGKQSLEVIKIWMRPQREAVASIREIFGQDCLNAACAKARESGRGVLYLTPHLGCFEIIGPYLAATFGGFTALYRPPRYRALHTLILTGRERENQRLAAADIGGVRLLIRALKRGEAVGLLPDQAPSAGEGVWLDFFGRPAYTMTLAARLTEAAGATLLVWGERLPKGEGYRLHFSDPLVPLEGDTLARAGQINREIENLARLCPSQYLWGYNRYKGSKKRSMESAMKNNSPQEP